MHATALIFPGLLLAFVNLVDAAPQNASVVLASRSSAIDAERARYSLNGRIVNGEKAALRQFPHQVSLRRSWSMKHFCGGGIISEHYVLTAAHCMYLNDQLIQPWTIVLVAGQLKLSTSSSTTQKRGVDSYKIHPKFDPYTLYNDVALLELKVPFQMTPEVNKAPLAAKLPEAGTFCQISGWGYPSEDVPITNNDLMYVDIPIVLVNVCRELMLNVTFVPPGMFCAGYMEGGKDACQGDSGGSMICDDVIAGIVSGGEGCARPRLPGLYSDVAFYTEWIQNITTVEITDIPKKNNAGLNTITPIIITLLLLIQWLV